MIHGVGTVRPNLHLEDRVGARSADSFDANADVGQVFGKTAIVDGEVNEVANPIGRKFHENQLLALSS